MLLARAATEGEKQAAFSLLGKRISNHFSLISLIQEKSGAIVSLDAHYAYVQDLQLIVNAGADFIVVIKGNQGNLEAEIKNYFDQANVIQECCVSLRR